jgi:hypothetical protein
MKSIELRLGLPLLALLVAGWPMAAEADDAADRARVERAVAHLDARQEAWAGFARAARGEGTDRTTCVSCHTGLSYCLARPALGRFLARTGAGTGDGAGLALAEARTSAAITLRVAHWAELDAPRFGLMYDSDDRKKLESRGTEAVMSALILARADAAAGLADPTPATRAALGYLWATQTTDGNEAGSWEWLNFGLEPWESPRSRAFGAALAALAVGTAPDHPENPPDATAARGAALLRDYLRRRFPEESLYNRLWILEASTLPAWADLLTAAQKRGVVEQLMALQHGDGGWALAALGDYKRVDGSDQPSDSDAYATGLALHVLLGQGREAASPELARGLAWLRDHQAADGSWPGRSVNKERDPATFAGKLMTDAATAIAATVLVEADASAHVPGTPPRAGAR